MPKFKVHAVQNMAVDFEITAVDPDAARAAISFLLAMSKIVLVPMEPTIAPRYVRGLGKGWELEITPKQRIH